MQEDYIKINTEWCMQGYIHIKKTLEDAEKNLL